MTVTPSLPEVNNPVPVDGCRWVFRGLTIAACDL